MSGIYEQNKKKEASHRCTLKLFKLKLSSQSSSYGDRVYHGEMYTTVGTKTPPKKNKLEKCSTQRGVRARSARGSALGAHMPTTKSSDT